MTNIEKIALRSHQFGWIHPDSKHFDDSEFLGDNFLYYKVTKIKSPELAGFLAKAAKS